MQPQADPAPWMHSVIPVAIVVVVIALRWQRMSRPRQLKIEMLWILPALYAAIVGFVFYQLPPHGAGWAWSALALVGGGAIGWFRGRSMRITVDPVTHSLSQQASPAAFLLLILLIVARGAAREEMGGLGHSGAMLATDIAMMLALGLIMVTRLEMALRARRLLRQARAGA